MNAELSPELTRLIDAARILPQSMIREVSHFAEYLGTRIGEDAELRTITIASLRRFETEHAEEDWGEDLLNPEGTVCSPPQM